MKSNKIIAEQQERVSDFHFENLFKEFATKEKLVIPEADLRQRRMGLGRTPLAENC